MKFCSYLISKSVERKNINFHQCPFELPANQYSQLGQSGLDWHADWLVTEKDTGENQSFLICSGFFYVAQLDVNFFFRSSFIRKNDKISHVWWQKNCAMAQFFCHIWRQKNCAGTIFLPSDVAKDFSDVLVLPSEVLALTIF